MYAYIPVFKDSFFSNIIFIRLFLHRIAAIARCDLLLQTEKHGLSVCVGLSVGHVRDPCKNGWTDLDAAWGVDLGGPKDSRVIRVQTGRIHLKPRRVTSRRCGLLPDYFGHLLYVSKDIKELPVSDKKFFMFYTTLSSNADVLHI